ncbi:MFS transporter [Blumeria hordei DH14]|uniref:MFS transporter n=1 Tax=Blumeria graminis f. sp. hordei (strain DH14) TaxID=546991 RepID=N1JFI7_BLUG1|nr:MFS transporter [Blumeria hordei DH14]
MSIISHYLPLARHTTATQAATYLFGVCLFSISFLVFLNASVSFVVTEVLGITTGVGNVVGTLGFADELTALVACPFWGILSDRLGVRSVCTAGYILVGISLILFVHARNVYPQLLLARLLFSLGAAATATMVTGILPSLLGEEPDNVSPPFHTSPAWEESSQCSMAPSTNSQITITPANYVYQSQPCSVDPPLKKSLSPQHAGSRSSRLAGLVGMFTGCGALVALVLFLPLPTRFARINGVSQAEAIADSFYVVGTIAITVAAVCFCGLRGLAGEGEKGLRLLWTRASSARYEAIPGEDGEINETRSSDAFLPYWRLLLDSTILGFTDSNIGLAYVGGFVARASSVGISLFIPLYVNAFFIQRGLCHVSPHDPSPEVKKSCREAYVLAAELTGASQLVALLAAPIFGIFSDRCRRLNLPLLVTSISGIIGYTAFARLGSPEIINVDGRGGSPLVFLIVSLIGFSQIGAIVCSLGLLGRGVVDDGVDQASPCRISVRQELLEEDEFHDMPSPSTTTTQPRRTRQHLKGSIAGIYSLSGGAAILLLTKLGGFLFDNSSTGAPFYMMASFNGILFLTGMGNNASRAYHKRGM